MPIKEYECRACSHKFESLLMLNEPDPATCPKCGKADLKRIMSTFRISGSQKKGSVSGDSMPDLPAGMQDNLDLGGMDDLGGDPGIGGDVGGGMPVDGGFSDTEES